MVWWIFYDIFKIPNKLKHDNVLKKPYDITILYYIRKSYALCCQADQATYSQMHSATAATWVQEKDRIQAES